MLMVMFALVFIILFIVDYRLFKIDFITHNYLQTRFFVTTIVVTSLIISGAFIIMSFNPQNIAVLGASGAIGGAFKELLSKKYPDVAYFAFA